MPFRPFTSYLSIFNGRGVRFTMYLLFFYKRNPYVDVNSVDPDQTPCSMACDQGLHCQCFGDARH